MEYKQKLSKSCNSCSATTVSVIEKEVIKEVPVEVPVVEEVIKYLDKECVMPKPVKITGCGDLVQILYDDGTFQEVSKDIICTSLGTVGQEDKLLALETIVKQVLADKADKTELDTVSTGLTALEARVSDLEAKEDKDTIFDPTSLELQLNALEVTVNNLAQQSDVDALKQEIDTMKANTVIITGLNGNPTATVLGA